MWIPTIAESKPSWYIWSQGLRIQIFPMKNILRILFLYSFASMSLFAEPPFRLISGNFFQLAPQTRALLLETDNKDKFEFYDRLTDKSAYPFIETTISFTQSPFSYFAFTYDGEKIGYSTRGEKLQHSKCYGNICLFVTDRNMLGVSNYDSSFQKTSIYNEEIFKLKFGQNVGFIVTERHLYIYNGFLNQWNRMGLESENIHAVANKNDLGLVVTSKRILFYKFPTDEVLEVSHPERRFTSFEIKENFIFVHAWGRVFQYDAKENQVSEILLDR